jgi:uncharacterized protein YhbP (UPF0306 family)
MDLRKLVQEYYSSNKHMQLATVGKGQPWVCTVYYAADDDLNLYWTSGRSRQHSREIMDEPRAAVTIVRDTERKQALQIVGNSYEVKDEDLNRVHNIYQMKFGSKDYDLEEIKKHSPNGRAYWVFIPYVISLWDEVNFPGSPKQVYKLDRKD